jgi:glucan phosphorylase
MLGYKFLMNILSINLSRLVNVVYSLFTHMVNENMNKQLPTAFQSKLSNKTLKMINILYGLSVFKVLPM